MFTFRGEITTTFALHAASLLNHSRCSMSRRNSGCSISSSKVTKWAETFCNPWKPWKRDPAQIYWGLVYTIRAHHVIQNRYSVYKLLYSASSQLRELCKNLLVLIFSLAFSLIETWYPRQPRLFSLSFLRSFFKRFSEHKINETKLLHPFTFRRVIVLTCAKETFPPVVEFSCPLLLESEVFSRLLQMCVWRSEVVPWVGTPESPRQSFGLLRPSSVFFTLGWTQQSLN